MLVLANCRRYHRERLGGDVFAYLGLGEYRYLLGDDQLVDIDVEVDLPLDLDVGPFRRVHNLLVDDRDVLKPHLLTALDGCKLRSALVKRQEEVDCDHSVGAPLHLGPDEAGLVVALKLRKPDIYVVVLVELVNKDDLRGVLKGVSSDGR